MTRLNINIDSKILESLYITDELSADEISIIYGVSSSTIRKLLHRFEIPIRSGHSERQTNRLRARLSHIGKNSERVAAHLEALNKVQKGCGHPNYGESHSETTRRKISESKLKIGARKGSNNPNWKGGINNEDFFNLHGIRLREWKNLSQIVRKRDKFICQCCGAKNSIIVHHIISRFLIIDNSLDNLITLCIHCHPKIDRISKKYIEDGLNPIEIFYRKWSI